MRRIVLLLIVVFVTGCANTMQARIDYLNRFVGRPESELVMSMGVPTRSFETGGTRFLAYDEQRTDVIAPTPFYGAGFWGYGGFPPQIVTWACETTVAVQEGVVRSFSVRGNGC